MDVTKLEGLAELTAEVDGEGPPTAEQAEQQRAEVQALDAAREWGLIAYTVGNALAMFAPELKQVYTEEACTKWGESVVPVAEKYGWGGPGKVPELGLLLSTAALAVPTVVLIRMRLKEAPEGKAGGLLGSLKAWWREKRAKKAAEVAQRVAEEVADGSQP